MPKTKKIVPMNFSRIKVAEFWSLIQAESLLGLARGMISIFVPIYLWQLGYRLPEILVFYMLERAVQGLTTPLAGWLAYKYGPQRVLALSYPLQVTFFILMGSITHLHIWIGIPAMLWGLALSSYWVGYHVDLSLSRGKHDHGRDLGTVQAIARGAAIFGPITSGFLATKYGFGWVFGVAAGAALVGSVLIWRTPEPWRERKLKYREVLSRHIIFHSLSLSLGSLQTGMVVIAWPLYVYLVVGSFEQVGLAATIAAIGPVVSLYVISHIMTPQNRPTLFRFGKVSTAIVHIIRSIITTLFGAIALSLIDGLISPLMDIPLQANMYHRLKTLPRIEYVVVEECLNAFVCVAGWIFLYVVAQHLDAKSTLHVSFGLAAVATLLVNINLIPKIRWHKRGR